MTASTSDVQPATVLVVDDNETNRYVLATWLRRAGHTVVGVGTGEEGLAYLRGSERPRTSPSSMSGCRT